MTYYKFLSVYGRACNGGKAHWHLPNGEQPGKWMPTIADIKPCVRGYHLCRREDLVYWLGPTLWIAEGRGARIECADKVVFAEARLIRHVAAWNERNARLFGCDCAERVLPLFEARFPNDKRPRQAIEVSRNYLDAADAADAAYAAYAAADAADAAYAAYAAADAADAAANAAYAAADAAADAADAADAAANLQERQWQRDRLCELLGIKEKE